MRMLIVEDNPGDVSLFREALHEIGYPSLISVVGDGIEAIASLRLGLLDSGIDLMVLDLNLPHKSGREVLAEMKSDPDLRDIPIAILTSSTIDCDIVKRFNLEPGAYFIKPLEFNEYIEVVRSIIEFGQERQVQHNSS